MNINLKELCREPSTKRGVVMFITGSVVLYQTIFGDGSVDISGMESRVEKWIGIGMMLAGLLGWLPDAPKEKVDEQSHQTDQFPPIDLVGRSESVATDRQNPSTFNMGFVRYRDPDDDQLQSTRVPTQREDQGGWNG